MDRLGLDWTIDRDAVLLGSNEDPTRGTEKLAHLSASEYVDFSTIHFAILLPKHHTNHTTHSSSLPLPPNF